MADMENLSVPGSPVVLRRALLSDVPSIVRLLAADELGAVREAATDENLEPYERPSGRSTPIRAICWSWSTTARTS